MWHAIDLERNNDFDVAVKILQPQEPTHVDFVEREIAILKRISHIQVAKLISCFTVAPDVYVLVLEYCGGPSLRSYIKNNVRLEERDARAILRQILSAMKHLNSLGIIHYDMKPENIMHDHLGIIKVVDFGWSKTTNGGMMDGSVELPCLRGGTTRYKPPEGFMLCGVIR